VKTSGKVGRKSSVGPQTRALVGRSLTNVSVESSRVGVIKALVDRATTLSSHEEDMVEVCNAYDVISKDPYVTLLGRVLRLRAEDT
jgi:hypothetical protein